MPTYNQYANIINPVITTNYRRSISTHQYFVKLFKIVLQLHYCITTLVIFSCHVMGIMFADTGSINVNIYTQLNSGENLMGNLGGGTTTLFVRSTPQFRKATLPTNT